MVPHRFALPSSLLQTAAERNHLNGSRAGNDNVNTGLDGIKEKLDIDMAYMHNDNV